MQAWVAQPICQLVSKKNMPEDSQEPVVLQTIQQKKSIIANQYADAVIELVKQSMEQTPLVDETEWKTLRNAITIDAQANVLNKLIEVINRIKEGDTSLL
jgi:hypothetical protein